MTDPAGLIGTSRRLARTSPRRPRQSDLKRAISTAYYALFHAVARSNADRLVGTGPNRSEDAWIRTYRTLDHGTAKTACQQMVNFGLSPGLVTVAQAFIALQEARHKADYDPGFRVTLPDANAAITQAEIAVGKLRESSLKERSAFAVELLMRRTRGS